MTAPRIQLLLSVLDEAFDKRSWHGPVLWGALRGVSAKAASWRPKPGRNTIRDLVYHCAYWKYCARNILISQANKHGYAGKGAAWKADESFGRSPANFPDPGQKVTEKIWRDDLKLLKAQHRKLRVTMAALPDAFLDTVGGPGIKAYELAHGVAAHDLYHCGQISYLKRLAPRI